MSRFAFAFAFFAGCAIDYAEQTPLPETAEIVIVGSGVVTAVHGVEGQCNESCRMVITTDGYGVRGDASSGWKLAGWDRPQCGRDSICGFFFEDGPLTVTFEQAP